LGPLSILSKVDVAGSNPVARSKPFEPQGLRTIGCDEKEEGIIL
jgi:hypothetical protein